MRFAVSVVCVVLFAFTLNVPAMGVSGGYADRFVKTIQVTSKNRDQVEGLVYGNSDYGYFETTELTFSGDSVSARLVPPGYRSAFEIYLRKTDKGGKSYLESAGKSKFTFPLSADEVELKPLSEPAKLTHNFVLGKGNLKPNGKYQAVAYAVNRYAEVVWVYSPSQKVREEINPVISLGSGRYALQQEDGLFEIMNFDGTVEKSVLVTDEAGDTVPLSHDFSYDGRTELLSLSYRIADYQGAQGSLLPPDRYLIGNILKIDLETRKHETVWDGLDDGPMLWGPGWKENPADVGSFGKLWFDPPANRDLNHNNSIFHVPGKGYLISERNQSTIAFLDESFQVQWSMGSAPGVTYDTKGTNYKFYRQHHATILPNGNILLVDNGTSQTGTRLLELQVDEENESVERVREFIPQVRFHVPIRGSAFRLSNGNTLGGFVTSQDTTDPHYAIEFDPSGKQVAILSVPKYFGAGFRFVPIDTIGHETYLGPSL